MDFKSNASSPRAVGGRVAAATVRSATALLAVGDACWRKVDTVQCVNTSRNVCTMYVSQLGSESNLASNHH